MPVDDGVPPAVMVLPAPGGVPPVPDGGVLPVPPGFLPGAPPDAGASDGVGAANPVVAANLVAVPVAAAAGAENIGGGPGPSPWCVGAKNGAAAGVGAGAGDDAVVLKNAGPPGYSEIGACFLIDGGIGGVLSEAAFFVFVVGDVVSFLILEAVSFSSSCFLCFNSVSLLREDPTLLGFNADFDEIDLSGVKSESLSLSFSA